MIKKIVLLFLLILFCSSEGYSQNRYVTYRAASWVLQGGTTDTLRALIGKGARNITIDTLGNQIKPPFIASYNGFCRINLSLSNINGTLDSVSLHSTPLKGSNGAISTNDSTFVIGDATTGAVIRTSDDYTITTKPTTGLGFVFKSYDQTTDSARINIEVWYTQ
jgi:hypothetical protein